MATHLQHQSPQPHRALSLVPPRLRVADCADDETVHLAQRVDAESPGSSLCGRTMTHREPRHPFQHSGCDSCADLALADGHLFVEDKHGEMVNLRRWVLRNRPLDRRPGPGPVLEWMGTQAQPPRS